MFVVSGEACNAEETVLSDSFTGSAGKRELPEGEEPFARRAAEGSNGDCVPLLRAFVVFTLPRCLQEREKLASLEGKYAELSEGQSLAHSRTAITEVGPGRRSSHTQLFPVSLEPSIICHLCST